LIFSFFTFHFESLSDRNVKKEKTQGGWTGDLKGEACASNYLKKAALNKGILRCAQNDSGSWGLLRCPFDYAQDDSSQ
jgi:hypothetical protein